MVPRFHTCNATGTVPNSTALFPRSSRRQRRSGASAVVKSETSILGPMPSNRIVLTLGSELSVDKTNPCFSYRLRSNCDAVSSMRSRSSHEQNLQSTAHASKHACKHEHTV